MASTSAINLALSEIMKSKDNDEPKKKTREDWRKAKELEEARKAGTAPAAVDEEGKDINPHIPQYISQTPWYYGSSGPTLKHQRPQPEKEKVYSKLNEWYQRGVSGQTATRYRKGACANCGAMTHSKKDCLERPRKVGAKYTGESLAPDEYVQPNLALSFDGKRDRWNGYDPEEYSEIVDEYTKVESAKRQLKADKLTTEEGDAANEESKVASEGESDDEDKYVDNVDMPGTKVDSKQRITVRNLRIREDTAKYLLNLDPNSAYYDPKTRAMRDNPYINTGKDVNEVKFAGDNFVRYTGDTLTHGEAQLFAWDAHEKGVDVHLLAEPTKLQLLNQEFTKRKEGFKQTVKDNILNKYGGEEHLNVPPRELLQQTESYVEYSRHGKIIKGQEKPIVRSRYEEDIYIKNHTSVWGSFWKDGQWGYQCCHNFIKNSYCTGEKGRTIVEESSDEEEMAETDGSKAKSDFDNGKQLAIEDVPTTNAAQKFDLAGFSPTSKKSSSSSSSSSSGSSANSSESSSESEDEDEKEKRLRKKKLEVALLQEEVSRARAERYLATDERKRKYNSMQNVQVPTDIEMEAYHMKKRRDDDPMAQFSK